MNISCSYLPFLNIIYGLLNSSEHTLGESFWKRTKYLPLTLSPNSINLSLINILHALLQKNWRISAPAINLLPFNPESHLLAYSPKHPRFTLIWPIYELVLIKVLQVEVWSQFGHLDLQIYSISESVCLALSSLFRRWYFPLFFFFF